MCCFSIQRATPVWKCWLTWDLFQTLRREEALSWQQKSFSQRKSRPSSLSELHLVHVWAGIIHLGPRYIIFYLTAGDLPEVKVQFGAVAALMQSLQSSALTVPGRRNLFALIVHIFPLNVQIICDVQIVLTNEAVQWSESSRDPFILSQTTFAGGAGTRGRERLVLLLCSLVTNR